MDVVVRHVSKQIGLLKLRSQRKRIMIHYSCDRCRRKIEPDEELRYSVNIKIEVALDTIEFESEEDRDHLIELNEILERLDESERQEISQSAYRTRKFDLCSDCHREYIQNPLAIDNAVKLGFSQN